MAKNATKIENNLVVVRPLSIVQKEGFIYTDFSDLKNLIMFAGSKPTVDEEGNLFFKNVKVLPNSLVVRDNFGKITEVISLEKVEEGYEIIASRPFTPEDAPKVTAKVISTDGKGKKSRLGLSRAGLRLEMDRLGIKWKTNQNNSVYEDMIIAHNEGKVTE